MKNRLTKLKDLISKTKYLNCQTNFPHQYPRKCKKNSVENIYWCQKWGSFPALLQIPFYPPPPFSPPPPPQPDYSQLRSSIKRFNSKICFVRLIFVKFTLNELVFRETNKRLCESNDDLRAALEVQKLSFLLFRCCCLFVFFVSFFSSFSPFIVSL